MHTRIKLIPASRQYQLFRLNKKMKQLNHDIDVSFLFSFLVLFILRKEKNVVLHPTTKLI